METRAPYALIGGFVLAAIVAAFGFVFWLHNTSGLGERTAYRIQFDGSVSGLLTGAAVLFNGIRVGEVTSLRLDPTDPRRVFATVAVSPETPVRPDTAVNLEFQGLTGVPVIALEGGSAPSAGWTSKPGETPTLAAQKGAGLSMTQAARDLLRKLDGVLGENSEPLRETIANLKVFTAALARNSDRIDAILAGFERMTGGAPPPPKTIHDLDAPRTFPAVERMPNVQLVVGEPTAIVMLDTQRIIVRPDGENPAFANAQWSDSLPKLFHARIIQSFENAGFKTIGRLNEGVTGDVQLAVDLRRFELSTVPAAVAEIELTAKIIRDGRIVDARTFQASVPAKSADVAPAAAALNDAFGRSMTELVLWTLKSI